MPERWLLLIYTVPAAPSRKRAYIWRMLKKAGAVYLRDGVAVLPQRPDALAVLRAAVHKIAEFDGQGTLVEEARLPPERVEALVAQLRATRTAEYAEIAQEAERFLEHIRHETDHRDFSVAELEELAGDLGKIKAWHEQVRGRDYLGAAGSTRVHELLIRCDEDLASLLDQHRIDRKGVKEAVEP